MTDRPQPAQPYRPNLKPLGVDDLVRGHVSEGLVTLRIPPLVRDHEFPFISAAYLRLPEADAGTFRYLRLRAIRRRYVFENCRFLNWRANSFHTGWCDFRNCDFVDCTLNMDSEKATFTDCRFPGSRLRGGISNRRASLNSLSTTMWHNNDVSGADIGCPSLLFQNIDLSTTVLDPARQVILKSPDEPALWDAVDAVRRKHPHKDRDLEKATMSLGVHEHMDWIGPQILQTRTLTTAPVSPGRQLYHEIVSEYIALITEHSRNPAGGIPPTRPFHTAGISPAADTFGDIDTEFDTEYAADERLLDGTDDEQAAEYEADEALLDQVDDDDD